MAVMRRIHADETGIDGANGGMAVVGDQRLRMRATGRLEGVIAIADLAAAVAAALLPPGLELLPQNSAPAGRHPLILLFGEHGRVGAAGLRYGLRYREFVLALPCVRPRAGPRGPFCHLPLLLLDRRLPVLLGRWLYGFAKRLAGIRWTANGFDIARRSDGAPLLEARCRPLALGPASAPVRGLLEQPLISGGGPRWRYARFDFGWAQARLQAVEAEIAIDPGLLTGLPVGPIRVERAFRLETDWTLRRWRPR